MIWWEQFERRWLQEKEAHSVLALQPLVSAVSAAEAVLKSCKKQRILPEPSATKQRECTFRALQAFCCSVATLANELMPVDSSCLFLDASTIVLAAAIAEAAASPAARSTSVAGPERGREGILLQPVSRVSNKEVVSHKARVKSLRVTRCCLQKVILGLCRAVSVPNGLLDRCRCNIHFQLMRISFGILTS